MIITQRWPWYSDATSLCHTSSSHTSVESMYLHLCMFAMHGSREEWWNDPLSLSKSKLATQWLRLTKTSWTDSFWLANRGQADISIVNPLGLGFTKGDKYHENSISIGYLQSNDQLLHTGSISSDIFFPS